MATKKSHSLTLKDKLSRLTYVEACKLLGEHGPKLIMEGGQYDIKIHEQVELTDKYFRLKFLDSKTTVVEISLTPDARQRLRWSCSSSTTPCADVGAAFSLILEEKRALGLAAPPPERTPVESLGEKELVQRAIEERRQRARSETMTLRSADPKTPWTDYTITNAESGKSYRVALRGEKPGQYYCSCPDFRTNTLGVCKHIFNTLDKIKKRFPEAERRREFRRADIEVYVEYGKELALRVGLPGKLRPETDEIVRPLKDRPLSNVRELVSRLRRLERIGQSFTVFPDAEEFIQQRLFQDRVKDRMAEIRKDPKNHPLRKQLLRTELLPYQLDGVAFAVSTGRAVLADDMGLGKTIQGVGAAEMLAREAGIRKVLIVCPATLKSQWRSEIQRFSNRDCQLVLGGAAARARQYENGSFFTICNYEQVLRDILAIERVKWDLIILDEGQRIKNWEAKTSNVIKGLKSPFALVLSGTPLENRLDDLYSVVQFIDDRRLAPAFRFFNRHRVVNEKGKVLGYKNLAELRKRLSPILLRRTRESVIQQLPPRTTEVVRIPPTDEQLALHKAHMQIVATVIAKKFISEMDLLRLQRALLMCRMAADSTFLVDKQKPGFSTKLERLDELVDQLAQENGRKTVLFSEWTTMLGLIEPLLCKRKQDYVRLDGSVPQRERQGLVRRFQEDPDCRYFIATNAGATGLNLQAANTVINVDLPWNPAVLEQRVGRAHRMGQKRPVHVFVLITEETIEENLLTTLSGKHQLALAALDSESDVDQVDLQSNIEELKGRLEILLGAKPEAPLDETVRAEREREAELFARRERVAAASGELLGAAFHFLGELVADRVDVQPPPQLTRDLKSRLAECVEQDESGRQRLTVTLPNSASLDQLALSLARLLAVQKP